MLCIHEAGTEVVSDLMDFSVINDGQMYGKTGICIFGGRRAKENVICSSPHTVATKSDLFNAVFLLLPPAAFI